MNGPKVVEKLKALQQSHCLHWVDSGWSRWILIAILRSGWKGKIDWRKPDLSADMIV